MIEALVDDVYGTGRVETHLDTRYACTWAVYELRLKQRDSALSSGLAQYYEDITSKRDGKLSAPITIMGPASAVLRGESAEEIVMINHDHIHLEGFSVNGFG